MGSTRSEAMKIDNDLFVVRARMAADRTRATTEGLARIAGGAKTGSNPRAWLGRRLVVLGTALSAERPAAEPSTSTGQPC